MTEQSFLRFTLASILHRPMSDTVVGPGPTFGKEFQLSKWKGEPLPATPLASSGWWWRFSLPPLIPSSSVD